MRVGVKRGVYGLVSKGCFLVGRILRQSRPDERGVRAAQLRWHGKAPPSCIVSRVLYHLFSSSLRTVLCTISMLCEFVVSGFDGRPRTAVTASCMHGTSHVFYERGYSVVSGLVICERYGYPSYKELN